MHNNRDCSRHAPVVQMCGCLLWMLTLKSSTENGTPANTLAWHTMMRPCLGHTWSTIVNTQAYP